MTTQQAKNIVDLCKGEPLGKVMQLLNLYPSSVIKELASHLNCLPTKIDVAAKLTS